MMVLALDEELFLTAVALDAKTGGMLGPQRSILLVAMYAGHYHVEDAPSRLCSECTMLFREALACDDVMPVMVICEECVTKYKRCEGEHG